VLAPPLFFWIYLSTYDVFGTSVAPALATLIPLEERRTGWKYFVAALLFAAAAWINAAIGLAMLFLIVATVFARRPAGESLRQTRLRSDVLVPIAYCVGDRVPAWHPAWCEAPNLKFQKTNMYQVPNSKRGNRQCPFVI